MLSALRYRPGQALMVAALAALITACAVFAPLYDRAMQQALVDVRMADTPYSGRGLQVSSIATTDGLTSSIPLPEDHLGALPPVIRDFFGTPVSGWSAEVEAAPLAGFVPVGRLMHRSGQCDHLDLVAGSCPDEHGEILVSEADVETFGLVPGSQLSIAAMPDPADPRNPQQVPLRVSGTYRVQPVDYWFGAVLTGSSGLAGDGAGRLLHDTWLTAEETFTSPPVLFPGEMSWVGLPPPPGRVGVDRAVEVGTAIAQHQRRQAAVEGLSVLSALPSVVDELAQQRAQSRITVPLLMVQLGFLALVVLWLVLSAATRERRPEIALARLRGQGVRGARRQLLLELLPVTLLGMAPGIALAFAACWWARVALLPGRAPWEAPRGVWLAVAIAGAALVALALVAVVRASREPVDRLLRRSSARRTGWRVGVGDALVVAASAGAVSTFLTGEVDGPVAMAAPALMALAAGIVVAHVFVPGAALVGRTLLARGAVTVGTSLLDAARSPATRHTVVVVTVASALAVFATDALLVGARNRTLAAEQTAGAPMVAEVASSNLAAVQDAVSRIDPDGREATVVARMRPTGSEAITTLAVDPVTFPAIALPAGQPLDPQQWRRLAPSTGEPIELAGEQLSVDIAGRDFRAVAADGSEATVHVGFNVVADGELLQVAVGEVPKDDATVTATAPMHCSDGCRLVGITLSTLPGTRQAGTVVLTGLTTPSGAVSLGPAEAWAAVEDPAWGSLTVQSTSPDRLEVTAKVAGRQEVTLPQAWLGGDLPVLLAGDIPPGSTAEQLELAGLDGTTRLGRVVATVPRVPGAPTNTAVTSLDLISRGARTGSSLRLAVWFAHADRERVEELGHALAAHGLRVSEVTTLAAVARTYDASAAAWSLGLGGFVGLAAVLLALLVLTILAVTGWRARSRDLASLRMTGVRRRTARRIAVLAQLPAVVVAVAAGAACGVVGAQVAMPIVPLFAEAPEVSTLDLATPWPWVLSAAAACLVALAVAAGVLGTATAGRARLARVKETV